MMGQALNYNQQQSKFSGLHIPSQSLNAGESVNAAMAANPNFAAALAAAITSIINGSSNHQNGSNNSSNNNVTTSSGDRQ